MVDNIFVPFDFGKYQNAIEFLTSDDTYSKLRLMLETSPSFDLSMYRGKLAGMKFGL